MILTIVAVIALLIAGFAIFAASRSSEFKVTRAAAIPAPAAVVFEHVNDLHLWQEWSPWAKIDPRVKNTFGDKTAGTGATFQWDGNKVGAGAMTIVESRPYDLIRIRLDFLKPFKATNMAEFTFAPVGEKTLVTWSMVGKKNFVMKAVGLFIDCDKMCGDQFEKGLATLQAVVEGAAVKA
jgi:hypothetical protein